MGRKLNYLFDSKPSDNHIFVYNFSKPYIKNKIVLDIGCWSGFFEQLAIKDVKKITGIDISSEVVSYASKKIPNANFKVSRAEKLEFKDKSFDTVIFSEVIEHVPKGTENKCIREINRVLKNKGILILSTPDNNLLSVILDPAYFIMGHRHYSFSFLKELLEKNGFKILKSEKYVGLVSILTYDFDMLLKHLFGLKIEYPKFVHNLIKSEIQDRGFAENILVAQKVY